MLFVHITTHNPPFCVVKYNVLNLIMTKVQLLCYGLTIIRDFTDNILVFNNTHNVNIIVCVFFFLLQLKFNNL